jgi:hypothetical protein
VHWLTFGDGPFALGARGSLQWRGCGRGREVTERGGGSWIFNPAPPSTSFRAGLKQVVLPLACTDGPVAMVSVHLVAYGSLRWRDCGCGCEAAPPGVNLGHGGVLRGGPICDIERAADCGDVGSFSSSSSSALGFQPLELTNQISWTSRVLDL